MVSIGVFFTDFFYSDSIFHKMKLSCHMATLKALTLLLIPPLNWWQVEYLYVPALLYIYSGKKSHWGFLSICADLEVIYSSKKGWSASKYTLTHWWIYTAFLRGKFPNVIITSKRNEKYYYKTLTDKTFCATCLYLSMF